MRGRDYLTLAQEVIAGGTERHWRGAVVHAYYALLLECRDALARWGRPAPQRDVHRQVRLTLLYARDLDVKQIGRSLDQLGPPRAHASYDMTTGTYFASDVKARRAVQQAADALALLDALDGDPGRRAAAIASLPPPIP